MRVLLHILHMLNVLVLDHLVELHVVHLLDRLTAGEEIDSDQSQRNREVENRPVELLLVPVLIILPFHPFRLLRSLVWVGGVSIVVGIWHYLRYSY